MKTLLLKRANASRSCGEWRDDDYDVLFNGEVVGRVFFSPVAPQDLMRRCRFDRSGGGWSDTILLLRAHRDRTAWLGW
jgi:hypothetical protein